MRKKIAYFLSFSILIILFPFTIFSAEEIINPSKFYVWNDFEKIADWTTDDWTNNILSKPKLGSDYVSTGTKSLEVQLDATQAGQQGAIQLFDTGSLDGVNEVKFDIYNSSLANMKIFLMLKTGNNWLYHESVRQNLIPGWNKGITFNLKTATYGTNGNYNGMIKDISNVRRFGIVVEPDRKTNGFIALDNIQMNGEKAVFLVPEKDPAGLKEVVIDDFESTGRLKWAAAGTWSCSTDASRTTEKASLGTGAMKASFDLTMPGQNAVFMIEDSLDLSDVFEMKADVYYPYDFPTSMSMALSTGDKWEWQEAKASRLKKGWNKDVTFNLKEKKWKNEASKWEATGLPVDTKNVKRLCLTIFPPDMGKGYVIFDNVRLKTSAPEKLAGLIPQNTGDLAFAPWNSFEKGVNWNTDSDQSGAVALYPAVDFGGEKNRGMQTVFSTQNNVDKAMYSYAANLDFSNSVGVKVDIYNPNTFPVKISFAFSTGDDLNWIETKQIGIAPGWNRAVYIDFTTASFKSADSNWNYKDYFDKRNDIRKMHFQIYPDQKVKGSLYLTDFKLARRNFFGEIGKKIGLTFNNTSRMVVEPIKYVMHSMIDGTFETITNWSPANIAGWGAAKVELSTKYASQGNKSIKLSFKDIGIKSGLQYVSSGPFDITDYKNVVVDVYNPGKILTLTMALKTDAPGNVWYESNAVVYIYPGWNKNVKINLNTNDWKQVIGTTQKMPISILAADKAVMKALYLVFAGGYEGTVYVDNLRWGTSSILGITDAAVEQDINLEMSPMDALTARVTFRGGYYHGQNVDLNVKSAYLTLRGFGNELNFSAGEPVKVFDDVFGLVDSGALGPNVMGLSLAGTICPINTSYMLMGLSLNNAEPWKLGNTFVGTARLKTYLFDKNYIGLMYLNDRRGYANNADIFKADVEQSAQVIGGDTSVAIPVANLFDLNVKGEYLYTLYGTNSPIYMFPDPPPSYIIQSIGTDSNKLLSYTELNMHLGLLSFYGYYRHIGEAFASYYTNPDIKAGQVNKVGQITCTMDDLPPFSILKTISPDFAAFVRNTNMMVEYDAGKSMVDTYSRYTITMDLKNDEALALYNYHIWAKYNYEGNLYKVPSLTVTGVTKILVMDLVTFKLLGRLQNTEGPVGDLLTMTKYTNITGFVEASVRFLKDFKLTGSYKGLSTVNNTKYSNWYAGLEGSVFSGALSFTLSYGDPPLSGYWLNDYNNETVQKYMFTLKGRF
ncbi:MAG: hypothetical protein WCJ94_07005 [bacterium]